MVEQSYATNTLSEHQSELIDAASINMELAHLLMRLTRQNKKASPQAVSNLRQRVLLMWLYCFRFSSYDQLQVLLNFEQRQGQKKGLDRWLKNAVSEGVIKMRSGDAINRVIPVLTHEGWAKADDLLGIGKPFVPPDRISLRALEHDLTVQRIVQKRITKLSDDDAEEGVWVASESCLRKLPGKKPDAVMDGKAVEVENHSKTPRSANEMLYKIQELIAGDEGAGSTGIDRVDVYCRAEGIKGVFDKILRESGRAQCRGASVKLSRDRIRTHPLPNDAMIQRLIGRMCHW